MEKHDKRTLGTNRADEDSHVSALQGRDQLEIALRMKTSALHLGSGKGSPGKWRKGCLKH